MHGKLQLSDKTMRLKEIRGGRVQAFDIFIIKLLSSGKMFITQDVNENMKTFVQKYINFVEKRLKYAHFEGNIKR